MDCSPWAREGGGGGTATPHPPVRLAQNLRPVPRSRQLRGGVMTGSLVERRAPADRRPGVERRAAERRRALGRRRNDAGLASETPADHIPHALQLIGEMESRAPTEENRADALSATRRL